MAKKKPTNHHSSWTSKDKKALRQLVRAGAPATKIAANLRRTVSAVRQHAGQEGISFRSAGRRGK